MVNTIVQLTTVHPRYDTRIFVNECKTLAKVYGNDFYLYVADGLGDEVRDNVQIRDLGKPGGGRLGRMIIGSWRALYAMRQINADIIHFHDSELIPLGITLSLLGHKVIYDVHEDVTETIKTRQWLPKWLRLPVSIIMGNIEKLSTLFFSAIVTVTPKIEKKFPKKKTYLIQNFPRITELEATHNVPYSNRQNIFAYVGIVTKRRSAVEMIDAFSQIPDKYNAQLEITGIFRPPELENDIKRLNGWKNTIYKGWGNREKIAKRLNEARAGIVLCHPDPNHMEAQPVKLFEYMATGLPVIASDFATWRKTLKGVNCAIFVNPQDTDSIARAILWIIENPKEAEKMGNTGRKVVEEKLNWNVESEKLKALYSEIIM